MSGAGQEGPTRSRWGWTLSALVPALVSNALLLGSVFVSNADFNAEGTFSLPLLYGALFFPLIAPPYLFFLGRRYVQLVHGGYQSVKPFVLMYTLGNLAVWACGLLLAGFTMKWS